MLPLRDLKVRSLTPRHLEVSWEVGNTFEDPLDYTFRIQRSEGAEGPFDYITDPFSDKYLFVDSQVDIETRKDRTWYYRIEVTEKKTSRSYLTEAVRRSAPPDRIAMEIRRQVQLKYQKVCGRRCWLFPVRTFGQRCPTCYDPVTEDSQQENCPTCYGTTYTRGYLTPIEIWVQFDPTPTVTSMSGGVRREGSTGTMAHTGYYPKIKKADMIVEPENRRWLVDAVGTAEIHRATVRQDLQLMEIELGASHFDVPADFANLHTDLFANPFFFNIKMDVEGSLRW